MNISAQVNIGTIDPPHAAAVLDLSQKETSAPARGLLLPRVPLTDLTSFQLPTTIVDTEEKATGMVVYNLAENAFVCPGLYVWDGSTWNRLMGEVCPPYVYIPPAIQTCMADYYPHDPLKFVDIKVDANGAGSGTTTTTLRFLTYNLGANPYLTPKEQMAYNDADDTDVSVYGGLYQWGRKDAEHSLRCANSGPNTGYFTNNQYPNYNPTADTKFAYGNSNWLNPATDQAFFWGNGKGHADQTTPPTSGENIHNPCPAGFRVPTQHEWALLGLEDGDFTNPYNDTFSTDDINGTSPNDSITWVPVVNGVADVDNTSWSSGNLCGYALYRKIVWDEERAPGGYFNTSGLNMTKPLTAEDAPEPLMFLPAAGVRGIDGSVSDVGNKGQYWSSTVNTVERSWILNFISADVSAAQHNAMASGLSVRCLAE
jgi:hypothetical protein